MTVLQIFRKANPDYFSIETVFAVMRPFLQEEFDVKTVALPEGGASPKQILSNLFFLAKQKSPIYHITGDVHYSALALPRKKTILTIHDAVFLHQHQGFKKWLLKKLWLQWPVSKSAIVTTISEASKKEIIRETKCAPTKIIVIPDPLDESFISPEKQFNSDCPVILQIGTWPNKNIERVAEALKGIRCHLRIIGKLSPAHEQVLKNLNIKWSNAFQLPKQTLIEEYRRADMVIFASTFEGFGLPVLESQAARRPLVASNIAPICDVAGKGAVLVDPFSVDSIRQAVLKLINDESVRNAIVADGFENIQKYLPVNIAKQYLSIYHQLSN